MGRLKGRQKEEREEHIRLAIERYQTSKDPSIRECAETFNIPYSTLRDRLQGKGSRRDSHRRQQLLNEHEEKSVVAWCIRMDDWGFPLKLSLVKEMSAYLIKKRNSGHKLGVHWLGRFLDRNPEIASRFSSRLERQRAFADNPIVLKDYFRLVSL